MRNSVREGSTIAQPLIENPIFPPMVSQMVRIGEETGELEKMLGKVADFYEDEVDASIGALTSIIEPLMMIGVGAMVGVILIAMYLPMFKMLKLVSNSPADGCRALRPVLQRALRWTGARLTARGRSLSRAQALDPDPLAARRLRARGAVAGRQSVGGPAGGLVACHGQRR